MYTAKSKKFKTEKEILSFYNENGWVLLKNIIRKRDLSNIQNDLNVFFNKNANKKFLDAIVHLNKTNKKKLHQFHIISRKIISVRELNLKLSTFQAILYPKKNIFEIASGYLLNLPKDKRLTYDFHQESNFMKSFDDVLSIHYPIFHQSDEKNGSMSVLSGSHKLGNLDYYKSRKSNNSYTNLIPKNIEKIKKKYQEVLFQLNPGDAAYFHKDLIHKSNYNKTNLPRPVGIGRFTSSFGNFNILKPSEL